MTSRSAVSGLAPGAGQQFPVLVTGEQYELTAGDYHAVVTGLGAGLRELSYAGQPVVYGYEPDELPPGAAGQLLAPWPNRVDHGRYEFEGVAYQLDLSEPKNGNAIHGLTRWAAWEPMHREPSRVLLRHLPHGYTGYPFSVQVDTEYELTAGEGLQVTVSATNRGSRPAPYGTGQHPYFTAGPAALDDWELELPAARWLPLDERGIPSGPAQDIGGTPVDFRNGHPIGDTVLDHALTGLDRAGDGKVWAHLRSGDRQVMSAIPAWPQTEAAATPQLCETLSPGASTMRSSPLTRAFGGQVMGSMATARRCRSPCRVSLVNTWSQP